MSYNIFNQVHLPLKLALISGSMALSKLADDNSDTAFNFVAKVKDAVRILKTQLWLERKVVQPYIFEYEPSIWAMITTDHYKLNRVSSKLEELVTAFYQEQGKDEQWKVVEQLKESYNEFMLSNFHHMDDEEQVLNKILWRYYRESVLIEIEKQMTVASDIVNSESARRLRFSHAA